MSLNYPPPRYDGEHGEVSASFRRAGTEPDLTYATGNTVHNLSTGASTDGNFGLYRWVMGGEPSGPGPHFHRSISESFFILTGTVRIYDGTSWVQAQPGDY